MSVVPAADPRHGNRVDAVVTHHLDGFRSGVARFNDLLAQHLGVPLVGLADLAEIGPECPLLSFKVRELPSRLAVDLEALLDARRWSWELFLHEFQGLPLERKLVTGAQRVACGNSEIAEAVYGLASSTAVLWTPGLLLDDRAFRSSEISIFSFGMAHKIQTDRFRHLKELLEASGRSYVVYVSAANHETATMRDAELVFEEMHEIFPEELYFLGNLSDVAIFNQLRSTTFFAAFFERGVRANNTSVASALEHGSVVITNLDQHSPAEFVHMESVIDIDRCTELPSDPSVLGRISSRAMEIGRERGWDSLVATLQGLGAQAHGR
jgi:hypothetical protein